MRSTRIRSAKPWAAPGTPRAPRSVPVGRAARVSSTAYASPTSRSRDRRTSCPAPSASPRVWVSRCRCPSSTEARGVCRSPAAEMKLHGACEKFVLKIAMQGHLPEDIIWRKKSGHERADDRLAAGLSHPFWKNTSVTARSLRAAGSARSTSPSCEGNDRPGETRKRRVGEKLWALIMLEAWVRHVVARGRSREVHQMPDRLQVQRALGQSARTARNSRSSRSRVTSSPTPHLPPPSIACRLTTPCVSASNTSTTSSARTRRKVAPSRCVPSTRSCDVYRAMVVRPTRWSTRSRILLLRLHDRVPRHAHQPSPPVRAARAHEVQRPLEQVEVSAAGQPDRRALKALPEGSKRHRRLLVRPRRDLRPCPHGRSPRCEQFSLREQLRDPFDRRLSEGAVRDRRTMLKHNPKLQVFVLHDASIPGCRLAQRLITDPEWFGGSGLRMIDLGLRPRHAGPFNGLLLEGARSEAERRSRASRRTRPTG